MQSSGASGVAVTVAIDSQALPALAGSDVVISTHVFEPEGRARGAFSQQSPLRAQGGWCEISFALPMAAGRHALRVGIEHRPSGRSGSVYLDVVVPDLTRRGVWLSGLAIDLAPAGPRRTDAAIRSLLPIVPTTRRETAGTDAASVLFRIYQGGTGAPTHVSRTIQNTGDNDTRVLDRTEMIAAAAFETGRMVEQKLALPMAGLAPGRYLLTISVRAGGAAPNTEDRRELVFGVK